MPKRITIAPHLSLEELEHRYRQAKEPVERSHYQIIWLLASGRRSEDVAAITGYSRSWIYELVWGYNRIGPESLGDGRIDNSGAMPLLNDVQQANLWQALKGPAPDGGIWNGRKVAEYLSELIGQSISRQLGWEYLLQMRMRLRVPRPSHSEADPDKLEAWKKKLQQEVERVRAEYPAADVEVWSEDEHRIGLHPVVRRLWVEQGEQPVAKVNWKREWLWLYAFVQPQTGQTYWWILPYVNTKLFSQVLEDFALHFGVGEDKHVVLPSYQARWHTSSQLKVPRGIHLVPLPPYSPELQPAERLWPLVNEPLANQAHTTLDALEELVYQRCRRLLRQQELIRGLTFYHWWPLIESVA